MTMAALLDARVRGYRVGVLEASDEGLPMYLRLGFAEYCRYQLYQRKVHGEA